MAVKKDKYLSAEEATARLPKGRPPGAKNKSTLIKEALRGDFDDLIETQGRRMLEVVFEEVIENRNMQAAKLLFDRMLPTSKAIDLEQLEKSKGLSISINIGKLEGAEEEIIEGEIIDTE